ncbi:uncharacterized protein CBL_06719 [Carabus blaptoides fortunei]
MNHEEPEKKKPQIDIPALAGAKELKKASRQTQIQAIEAKLKLMETGSLDEFEINKTAASEMNIPTKQADILEDRYIYCDECLHEHLDVCKEHMLLQVLDISVPANKNNSDRARDTLPYCLFEVNESKTKDDSYGIWAVRKIPKGLRFGPYEGVTGVHLPFLIKQNGRVINYIDGFDTSRSNWMPYVNRARNKEVQNLMAF